YQVNNKVKMSEDAKENINDMYTLVISTLSEVIDALDQDDWKLAEDVMKKEERIDLLERKYRKQHILRVNEGRCSAQAGIVFVDIIINLERMGDHCVNIAESILDGLDHYQEYKT